MRDPASRSRTMSRPAPRARHPDRLRCGGPPRPRGHRAERPGRARGRAVHGHQDGRHQRRHLRCRLQPSRGDRGGDGGGRTDHHNRPLGTYALVLGELKVGNLSGTNITLIGAGAATTIIQAQQPVPIATCTGASGVLPRVRRGLWAHGRRDLLGERRHDQGRLRRRLRWRRHLKWRPWRRPERHERGLRRQHHVPQHDGGATRSAGGGRDHHQQLVHQQPVAHGHTAGAIWVFQSVAGGVTVTGSTFSGNSSTGGALGGQGGAVYAACNICSPFSIIELDVPQQHGGPCRFVRGPGRRDVPGLRDVHGALQPDGRQTGTRRRQRASTAAASVTATDNWWGCNLGPGNAGCDGTGNTGGVAGHEPVPQARQHRKPGPDQDQTR